MKCKYCGNRITAERRKTYCSNECYQKGRREERKKPKEEEIKHGAVLKSLDVCKGCKYLFRGQTELRNTCAYMEITGRSRVLVELEHGGAKADSCCCYEAGNRVRKPKGAY